MERWWNTKGIRKKKGISVIRLNLLLYVRSRKDINKQLYSNTTRHFTRKECVVKIIIRLEHNLERLILTIKKKSTHNWYFRISI